MTRFTLLPAQPSHAVVIAPHLRQAHLDEARLLDIHPIQAVAEQIAESYEAWTGAVDGQIAAIWGLKVPALLATEAYPWIVTTPLVERNVRLFMSYSKGFTGRWAAIFPQLRAFCHFSNDKSARWLEWMGFAEVDGIPGFRQFTIGGTQWRS